VPQKKTVVQRQYRRFPVCFPAEYACDESVAGKGEVCDISPVGMALKLYSDRVLDGYESIRLTLQPDLIKKPAEVQLNVRWIKALDHNSPYIYMAGGTHTFADPILKNDLIEYAYNTWFRSGT